MCLIEVDSLFLDSKQIYMRNSYSFFEVLVIFNEQKYMKYA